MNGFNSFLRWLFSPMILAGSAAFALLLLGITLGTIWFLRPVPVTANQPTAVLYVIPAPTATLPPPPTATPLPEPSPTLPVPPPPPGEFSAGSFVQVVETGGEGLRLRTDAGLNTEVRLLAAESEIFQVQDGPQEADGFTWWYLVSPSDGSRRGWGVANYLSAAQTP